MILRRRLGLLTTLLPLLAAACHSRAERAAAYEARFDRDVAVQNYGGALSAMSKALAMEDTDPARWLKLARLQAQLGQTSQAAGSYQSALDLQPDNVEALQNLAILSVRGGLFSSTRKYTGPLLTLNPNDPAGLLASGALALHERRFADAQAIAAKIVTALPDQADGYIMQARALAQQGKPRDAVAVLEKRLVLANDRALLEEVLGLYRQLGDAKGVQNTAIRLMPLAPDDARYALEAVRAYQAQGKADELHQTEAGIIQHFGTDPAVMRALGSFWLDTLPKAAAQDRIAALAADKPPAVRSALADELIDSGDAERSIRLLAGMAPPQVTAANIDAQAHYARALLATRHVQPALDKANAVLAVDGDNVVALLVRAQIALARQDFASALRDAQLASADDDSSIEAFLLVPRIYARQGNQLLAGSAYGTARQQFPNSATVAQAEIDWLIGLGRTDQAAQRASAFRQAHQGDAGAAAIYRATCAKTKAPLCRGEVPMIARLVR